MDVERSRCYLCTLIKPRDYGYDPEMYLEEWVTKKGAKFAVGQMEIGASGTEHLQFCIYFKNPISKAKLLRHNKGVYFGRGYEV